MTAPAAEALAGVLFGWNTPDDPYFVINGRVGEVSEEDPYLPIARAALIAIVHGQVPGVVMGSTDVPPGPCWHDPGVTWPDGRQPRCELLAGHAGAHVWDQGTSGGTAVWTDEGGERSPGSAPAPLTEAEQESVAEQVYEAYRLGRMAARAEHLPDWHDPESRTRLPQVEIRRALDAVETILAARADR